MTDPMPERIPSPARGLLTGPPRVLTAGVALFDDSLAAQSVTVTSVDWRPPGLEGRPGGTGRADDAGLAADLARIAADPRRAQANALAVERILAAGAVLVDVRPAGDALGLKPGTLLHAGPPLDLDRINGPMLGALQGALVLEGLADTPEQAEAMVRAGQVKLEPCHHHRAVGPMAGVVSPSMWMFELENPATGGRAFCSLNEGLGKVLRYGAYGPEVIDRLRWMGESLGPLLQHAVRARSSRAQSSGSQTSGSQASGPVDIKAIIAQMLQMGDEGHNRNRAGTLMLLRELLPDLIDSPFPREQVARAVAFVAGNDHFFLNLVMPAGKLAMDAARDVPGSSIVVAMARNGTDFGIQVSGTGDRWFTAPANTPEGLYLAGFGPEDANPDIGDSAITETAGIGGFAMAAAPAIVRLVGADVGFALATTARMYEITQAENPALGIPILEFRGTPTGIDVTRVVRTGILPQINTGMAGRVAGTGQVGAGLVTPPAAVFEAALKALAESVP
jgi:Protein of unknown function (DUF1116)